MKRFLKPIYHSNVFWYSVIALTFCIIWGSRLTNLTGHSPLYAWMAIGLSLIFAICFILSILQLNRVELTDQNLIIRHALSLRQPIRIAYHKIAQIELQQRGRSQILLRLTTTNGRRINRLVALVRNADRTKLCSALQQKGVTCRLTQ